MSNTNFQPGTVVESPWLNDVNDTVYAVLGDGTNAPADAAAVRTNLGLGSMSLQESGSVTITGGTIETVAATDVTMSNSNISDSTISNTDIDGGEQTNVTITTGSLGTAVTAVTQAASSNSTAIATTAWNKLGFAVSLGAQGYLRFPTWLGGVTIQWGNQVSSSTPAALTQHNWPIPFTTAAYQIVAVNGTSTSGLPYAAPTSTTQYTIACASASVNIRWIAIGV